MDPDPTAGRARGRRTRAAAAIALAIVFGSGARATAQTGDALLDRYRAALLSLPPLRDMVFQYTESRTGPTRTLVEEHRVYRRADGAERNETIGVNGSAVIPAIVRFSAATQWPYDVRAFAVDAIDYTVLPIGAAIVGGHKALGYSVVRTTTGEFAITHLFLDERRALPLRETFDVSGGGCAGTGTIDFAPSAAAWLPSSARVSCTVADSGGTFRESIVFHDYAFPPALPPDVFQGAQ